MHPDLFTIPGLGWTIHSYGAMLVIGLILAIELAKFMARRSHLNPDDFSNAAILALVSGIIGARIAYVIQFFDEFTGRGQSAGQLLWNMVNLTSGGLVYYGGFLLAFLVLVIWAIRKKMPVPRSMDIVAPCLMIGLGLGRVGCFLNGCCGGTECQLPAPLAVQFPYGSETYDRQADQGKITIPDDLYRPVSPISPRIAAVSRETAARDPHLREAAARTWSLPVINTQLISTVTALLIALVSYLFFTLNRTPGQGFALMMILEGLSRTLIEGMRVEPRYALGLSLSMIIGLIVALAGVAMWFVFPLLTPRKASLTIQSE